MDKIHFLDIGIILLSFVIGIKLSKVLGVVPQSHAKNMKIVTPQISLWQLFCNSASSWFKRVLLRDKTSFNKSLNPVFYNVQKSTSSFNPDSFIKLSSKLHKNLLKALADEDNDRLESICTPELSKKLNQYIYNNQLTGRKFISSIKKYDSIKVVKSWQRDGADYFLLSINLTGIRIVNSFELTITQNLHHAITDEIVMRKKTSSKNNWLICEVSESFTIRELIADE